MAQRARQPDGRKVVVAKGGRSFEREVSLRSGHRAEEALEELGYDVHAIDVDQGFVTAVKAAAPDFVFVAMHGKGGEDGTLQDVLEVLRIPYTGSDVVTSALCMDKVVFKQMLVREELPTPAFHAFSNVAFNEVGAAESLPDVVEQLGLPLVIKPAAQGSSIGIKFARAAEEIPSALLGAFAYDDRVLLEQYVEGREMAVTLLGPPDAPEALPMVEIRSRRGYYSYEAHYEFGEADLNVPTDLEPELRDRIGSVAVAAYSAMGCRDFARVDLIVDAAGTPQILEINTIPGLTETGVTPLAASEAGLGFAGLIERISQRAAGAAGAAV